MLKKPSNQPIKNRRSSGLFQALPAYGKAALLVLILAELLLFSGIQPVGDFFFLFVWWPYIFLADAVVMARTGRSLIFRKPLTFLYILPWSVTIWLIFEFYNFRLSNWHYVNLEPVLLLRWICYTLSFATVLPGLFITAELLKAYGVFNRTVSAPFKFTPSFIYRLQVAGGVMLVLPLLFPVYFFPLVWGGFVLVFDAVNKRLGAPSLIGDLTQGRPGRILRLLAAGLICGFLWEFWNFWASAKWIYTVPFVGNIKIFEMPVPGFLGFPPFALECFVMYTFISVMGGAEYPRLQNFPVIRHCSIPVWKVGMFNAVFWCPAFYLIDHLTVLSFR